MTIQRDPTGARHIPKLETIEGLGEAYASLLREAGITTVEALLEVGRPPEGRGEIQKATEIGDECILDGVKRADHRIRDANEAAKEELPSRGHL